MEERTKIPPAVSLRQTTEGDLADLLALWNDGNVMKYVGFPDGLGYDLERMRRWFERLTGCETRHHFVVEQADVRFCGETYYSVDRANRRAELDIKLCMAARGRGIASVALGKLVSVVFENEPEVDSVWVEPWDENTAAHRLYERCGFRPGPRPENLGPGPSYWERRRPDPFSNPLTEAPDGTVVEGGQPCQVFPNGWRELNQGAQAWSGVGV